MRKIAKIISTLLITSIVLTTLTVTPILADNSSCYIGSTGYSSLQEAVYAAETDDIIVITDDIVVDERINYRSDTCNGTHVTITDDGNSHTITIANANKTESGGYGRGIQVYKNNIIDIVATEEGNLVFDGTGNAGVGFMVYSGAINLTNVTVKNFTNTISKTNKTGYGGAMCIGYPGNAVSASATLTNVTFENNNAKSAGKDIYVTDGKTVNFNGINVASDIYVGDSSTINLLGGYDSKSSLGITAGSLSSGTSLVSGKGLSKETAKTFYINNDSSYYIDPNGDLCNNSVDFGEKKSGGLSYTFPNVSASINNGAKAIALQVDNGTFTIDPSKVTEEYKVYALDDDYNYLSTLDDTRLTAASIVFDNNISSDELESFIKACAFYPGRNDYPQKVSLSTTDSLNDDEFFGLTGTYCYNERALTYKMSEIDASSNDISIATISNLYDSMLIPKALTPGGFISLIQKASRWQWNSGSLYGTVVSANASTSEGYEGAFVNWADGEPKAENTNAVLNSDGTWSTCSSYYTGSGYYSLVESSRIFETNNSVKVINHSVLSSMKPSLEGDISMYYYFNFDSNTLEDSSNKVVVTIGDNEIVTEATISEMSEITDDQGNYGIKVSFPAKMMNADVRLDLVDSTGGVVRSYGNTTGENTDKNYNPYYYAKYILESSKTSTTNFSSDLLSMIKAMLNYGAATQVQFNYNADNLVNKGYEDTSGTVSYISIKKGIYAASGSGVTWNKAKLIADSITCMRLCFTPNSTDVSATVDGEAVEVNTEDDQYYIDIPVSANNIFKEYVIKVYSGSDVATLTINEAYVLKTLLSESKDAAVQNTASMLYRFGVAARKYKGEFSQNTIAQEAILNTAYAYLKKGAYTQYDMKSIADISSSEAGGTPQSRRELLVNLEDLDELQSAYLDCSSFIFNTYRSVYNYNDVINAFLSSEAAKIDNFRTKYFNSNPKSSSVVYSVSGLASSTWYKESAEAQATYYENWENVCETVKSIMQPGDVVTYYGYNTSGESGGHILMWVGDGFIHSTGSSYDISSVKDCIENAGSVCYKSADSFNASYIKKHGAMTMVVLRPSLTLGNDKLSSYATTRTQLDTLDVSAICYNQTLDKYMYNGQGVNISNTLKYIITLDNTDIRNVSASNKLLNICFNAPTGLEIVSADAGATITSKKVSWNDFTVLGGEKKTLTITLKVVGSIGTKIPEATGYVSLVDAGDNAEKLSFSFQQTEIEKAVKSYTIEDIQNLVNTYAEYSSSGTAPITVLKNVFSDLNISVSGLNNYSTDNALFNSIFKSTTNQGASFYEVKASSCWDNYLVSNVVGGLYLACKSTGGDFSAQNRVKALKSDYLQIGDVIQTYRRSNGYYDYYIYLGNNQVMRIDYNGETSIESFSVLSATSTFTYETGLPAIAQQRSTYAVLRFIGR